MSGVSVQNVPNSLVSLVSAHRSGFRPEYLPFPDWGGAPPLGWLAPFAPSPFQSEGRTFFSAEHLFMYEKAIAFDDALTARAILSVRTALQAQFLGRSVRGFDENRWQVLRESAMDTANFAKFGALSELRQYLLETHPKVLVLASPLDVTWGAGLDLADPMLNAPPRLPGLNLVGFSLMRVRERLRSEP